MLPKTIDLNVLAGNDVVDIAERLSMSVAPDCTRFSLRVGPEGRDEAGRAFGCALPTKIGGLAISGDRVALCLGPDEWLLMAPPGSVQDVEIGVVHSLVDVSHREVGIEVMGRAAEWALNAVCPLDLDAMPAGSATRTILDKVQVILIKRAPDHYRIEVWQSFAAHVWRLLAAVANEIALDL